ncbi:alpha/beta fold hydrolase [uncultured Maribacter sp.]|uniref:alpha/beta hydrolase n=1 Tax=uncultured Maribacter sp. TaxID=431308 RepID=UPI0030EF336E|tara:strand:- start:24301 stop:25200 length:900 start_codon:yes stop_codon:yes gene_type:complete
MKYSYSILLIVFILFETLSAQSKDTLVDVGGYKMHFNIIEGSGIPILFESGSGNDGSVWNDILEKTYKVTGTTLITYDRSGFGKSEVNPKLNEDSKFGILNGIKELEKSLEILGYNKGIILVSHSYGAFYNSLYVSRHPNLVKSIVLVDAATNTFWNKKLLEVYHKKPVLKEDYPNDLGMYYLVKNYKETVKIMKDIEYPSKTPILNIYSENPFSDVSEYYTNRWVELHKKMGDSKSNVLNIPAYGSTHYIFRDNPSLVINAIIKAYLTTLTESEQCDVLKKVLDNSINLSIEAMKKTN